MKKFTDIFRGFIIIAFCIIVSITLIEVFMRYVMSNPFKWAEEFSRYVFVWGVMIAIAIGCYEEGHIRLNMFNKRFGKTGEIILFLFGEIVMLCFNAFLVYYGFKLSMENMSVTSPAMKIPIGIPYLGIPVGALVSIMFLVLNIIKRMKEFKNPTGE